MSKKPIKIVVIDDDINDRRLIHEWSKEHDDIDWLGNTDTIEEGLEKINTLQPDVVILDVRLTGKHDPDVLLRIEKIKKYSPHIKIISYTWENDECVLSQLLEGGSDAIALKQDNMQQNGKPLFIAVRDVYQNKKHIALAPNVLPLVLKASDEKIQYEKDFNTTQRTIIQLLAENPSYTTKNLAEKMHITEAAIRTAQRNALKKRNLKHINELIIFYKTIYPMKQVKPKQKKK